MSLALKVIIILLTILLGAFPSYFTIVVNSSGSLHNRLNTAGWVVIGFMIILAIVSIIVEMKNNKESEEAKNTLNDIKNALEKSKLHYDSTAKTIINNADTSNINFGTSGISLNAGGNAQISGNQFNGNSINTRIILDFYELEETINKTVELYNITDREAYVVAFKNTTGEYGFPEARKVLARCGFTVIGEGYIDPIGGRNTKGFKVLKDNNTGKLVVAVGDTEPMQR